MENQCGPFNCNLHQHNGISPGVIVGLVSSPVVHFVGVVICGWHAWRAPLNANTMSARKMRLADLFRVSDSALNLVYVGVVTAVVAVIPGF